MQLEAVDINFIIRLDRLHTTAVIRVQFCDLEIKELAVLKIWTFRFATIVFTIHVVIQLIVILFLVIYFNFSSDWKLLILI